MTIDETQLRGLLKSAPTSLVGLMSLLIDGLGWPHYDLAIEPQDYLLDWSPEELHLDPKQVAKLKGISQIPAATAKQKVGTFVLQFEGGQLPIGAIRRVVKRLVTNRRGKGGATHPTWG